MPLERPVIFTPRAGAELRDAQDWYEGKSPGLGRSFRVAVDALVERMAANPRQFPAIYKGVRRALVRRFPYALMFVVGNDESLTVIACFHGSRIRNGGSTGCNAGVAASGEGGLSS